MFSSSFFILRMFKCIDLKRSPDKVTDEGEERDWYFYIFLETMFLKPICHQKRKGHAKLSGGRGLDETTQI